ARAAEAGMARKLSEADARTTLELHEGLKNPSLGMRSAGTQRLARACLAQGPEFAARVLERHPGEFGRLLQRWVKEERNRPVVRGDGGRADIVEQMERLAQKGIVDRPMRLPPPPKRPLPAPPSKQSAPLPGGKLLPPPPRAGISTAPARGGPVPPGPAVPGIPQRRPLLAPPPPRPGGPAPPPAGGPLRAGGPPGGEAPRRDFMAERAARNAGALSSRPGPEPRRDPLAERAVRRTGPPPGERRPPVPDTDPRAQPPPPRRQNPGTNPRVLRDGKPREPSKDDTLPPKGRAQTSPALQNIPRLKGAAPGGPHAGSAGRPPTVSRSAVLKGSNRGPKGGSG
ncbi:MAG: hypothetical protein ACYC8T_33975, partial [Myxococcaceae bacterium]